MILKIFDSNESKEWARPGTSKNKTFQKLAKLMMWANIYVYFVETITNKVINKSNIRHRIYNLQALGQS